MERRNFIAASVAAFFAATLTKLKSAVKGRTDTGYILKQGQSRIGRHYTMKGITKNIMDLKISSKDTDGALVVFEQTGLSQNDGPPLHLHPNQDEWMHVLEGNYLFQVGEDKFHAQAGDMVFMPKNVQHAFVQLSEKSRMIVSYQPAGMMESFFEATDKWEKKPTKDEIEKVFTDNSMKVLGPPLKAFTVK